MKKQILEGLRAKFPGVSDSILNRIAEKLAKTVTKEEDVAAAVEDVTFQSVLESYGDSRATEATQSAVTNYEKRHGLKEGQKVEGGDPAKVEPAAAATSKEGDDDMKKFTAAVAAAIKPLQDEIAELKSGKVADTRKQRLTGILSKAPAKFKERIEKDFDRLAFADEEDFTSWLDDVQTDTEAAIAEESTKGAVFGVPGASNQQTPSKKEPSKDEVEEVAKHLNLG